MAKHRRLDRASVVAQAAALADEMGGAQQVTLTTLAAALDIRVPSLYNHISSLDDLHDALAVYAMQTLLARLRAALSDNVTGGEVGRGEVGPDALGQRALTALAWAYRAFAQEHPGLYSMTLRAPGPDNLQLVALAQELLQMLLLVFASMGLQGDDAIHAVRGLRAVLHGFTSLEAGEGFKMALDLDESFRRLLEAYLAGLPVRVAARPG